MNISVILPCYNGAQTIAVQLEALANQQYSDPWELIVVNNGSTDRSMEIVEQYRDRLPNLRIVDAYTSPGPRLGVSHSYNVGLKAATGDVFAFCEADDKVAPGWLAAIRLGLRQYEMVSGPLEYQELNEAWILKAHNGGSQSEEFIKVSHKPFLPFAFGCNLAMRRSVYERIGEIDESFRCAWDMDYCFKAQLAGIQLCFIPDIKIHYRVRHSLRAIYRQSRNWGEDNVLIRKRYGVGMGKLELFKGIVGVVYSLFQLARVRDKVDLARWMFSFGWQVGGIQGLMKYFILGFFSDLWEGVVWQRQEASQAKS